MGKNDDLVNRAAANAFRQQQQPLQVAAPFNDVQCVAWVASLLYPHVPAGDGSPGAREVEAVASAVELVALSAMAVRSKALSKRMQQLAEQAGEPLEPKPGVHLEN